MVAFLDEFLSNADVMNYLFLKFYFYNMINYRILNLFCWISCIVVSQDFSILFYKVHEDSNFYKLDCR